MINAVMRLNTSLFPSVMQFLDSEGVEANSVFDELQGTLSTHQGEMALFAGELRQVLIFTLSLGVVLPFTYSFKVSIMFFYS